MRHRIYTLTVILVIAIFTAFGCAGNTEKKPVPAKDNTANTPKYSTLMAEAGADPYKNGCVSCHTKKGDVDRSLPVYVKKIEGHPEVTETTVNACYVCHEAQKRPELYKRFVKGIHRAHWKSSIFYQKANGHCYSCHTVESNGVSGLKEYPLAGYRSLGGVKTESTAESKIKTQPKTKAQPKTETKQDQTKQNETNQNQSKQGEGQAPQQNAEQNRSGGLAVPQNGNADSDLPVPTP